MGYSASGPLGFDRPGVYLHNGPYRKDPVMAACCDHSSLSMYTFNNNSYVMLPSTRDDGRFEESVMRAVVEKERGRVVLGYIYIYIWMWMWRMKRGLGGGGRGLSGGRWGRRWSGRVGGG